MLVAMRQELNLAWVERFKALKDQMVERTSKDESISSGLADNADLEECVRTACMKTSKGIHQDMASTMQAYKQSIDEKVNMIQKATNGAIERLDMTRSRIERDNAQLRRDVEEKAKEIRDLVKRANAEIRLIARNHPQVDEMLQATKFIEKQ